MKLVRIWSKPLNDESIFITDIDELPIDARRLAEGVYDLPGTGVGPLREFIVVTGSELMARIIAEEYA